MFKRTAAFIVFLISISLISLSAAIPTYAQTRGLVLRQFAQAGSFGRLELLTAGNVSQPLFDYPAELEFLQMAVSPNLAWLAAWGTPQGSNVALAAYRRMNGRPNPILLPNNVDVIGGFFSADSRYFIYNYTSRSLTEFGIGMVEISTGRQLLLNGNFSAAQGLGGLAALPIGFDGRNLIVAGFAPYSDAGFGGLYRIDVSGTAVLNTGIYPLPRAARLSAQTEVSEYAVAPNQRQVAILYHDPANPPQGAQPAPGPRPANSLTVIEVANGRARRIAQAGPGLALSGIAWTDDSSQIYFTGGLLRYDPNGAPRGFGGIFAVNVGDGQVRVAADLGNDGAGLWGICGGTLFWRIDSPNLAFPQLAISNPAAISANDRTDRPADSVQVQGCNR
ncbi:MAG: hypothetical protein OHK0023_02970 [Anaerolineae bacterium]